ncbi:MAG: DNA primase [Coprococcus sp.]|nr:DNA primase [Coprococcus sp.]
MYYSDEIIEEVRSRNDIVDVISGYVKLTKKGSSYFGLCPFHNEKSPSFSVSRDKQMYYCFGCGAGGNVFTFIMEYENYSFVEAVRFLAERAGVSLPAAEESEEAKKRAGVRNVLLEINKAAARYYYARLKSQSGQAAYRYLTERGLTKETITAFGLGASSKYSNDLHQYLRSKGYSNDMIRQAGLVNVDEKNGIYDKFWNRVMFPIMDVNNRVVGFGGRVMGDGKPKYLNSPETMIFDKSRNLYGLHKARSSRKPYFLICEGYMDVISLHQAGYTNAVASLGTALTAGHASLIKRYVNEVYLTYDSDDAGTRAALRAVPILKEAGVTARVIRMEPYKDPDEFIKNLGAEAFEERIRGAQNGFLFGLKVLEGSYDMASPEGKTGFLREAARRLAEFDEEIERDNYIEAVAKRYDVGASELKKLVVKTAVQAGMASPAARPRKPTGKEGHKEDGNITSQKILLTWLIDRPELFGQVSRYIGPEDFTTEMYRKVAELLYEQYEKGEVNPVNPARIINHFTEEEEHREAASLFNTRIEELSTKQEQEKAVKETLLRVKDYSIQETARRLDPADIRGLQQLMNAKKELQDLRTLHISIN